MTKPKAKTKKKAAPVDLPFAAPGWPKNSTMWRLGAVHPHPQNPRTHPPAQIDLLADLLKKFGPDQPIVVDEDGVILKGHGRRLAAIKAGFEEFPVVQRFDLSEADKSALRISDNQVALLAGWDTELMKYEIGSLKNSGYDINLLGFGEAQLVQFTTTPGPPGSFAAFGEDIEVDHVCPKCGYAFSGGETVVRKKPKPKPKNNGKKR